MIDGATQLPRIVDLPEFRRGLADDPHRDAVEALWCGRPADAARLLGGRERTVRVRALLADCSRDLGDLETARKDYVVLVAECEGTPWEAVMRQHLGKVLFTAGRPEEAAEQFARALELRELAGADESLLASSRRALEVARAE